MAEHELKTWPSFYAAVDRGDKQFEVRRADRDYRVGDVLVLREFDPDPQLKYSDPENHGYTGRELSARVTYVLPIGNLIRNPPLVALGIRLEEPPNAE